MSFKRNIGWIAIVVTTTIPLLIWFVMSPLIDRFSGINSILTSLGQIFGLTGMVLFTVSMILSGRLKFLEKYFYGLNQICNIHHWLGGLSFILLLFHPLFLATKYFLFSPQSAVLFLLPSSNWNNNFGIFSLFLMIVLLFLTFFIKLIYENWKLSHKFLGLAFFLGGLHAFLVPSDISRSTALKLYMLFLAIIALVVFFYRSLLHRWLVVRSTYIITDIQRLNNQNIEISFQPQSQPLIYQPGQFVFVGFDQAGLSPETHPFSISSSPSDSQLKIALKFLGDYTHQLDKLQIASLAKIEGPFGIFSYKNTANTKQIWIGGGIGITPFLSMLRSLTTIHQYQIDLYYCNRNQSDAVFQSIIEKIIIDKPNIQFYQHYSETEKHLTIEKIKSLTPDFSQRDIFICGPVSMIHSLRQEFLNSRLKNSQIHTEEFQLY